VKGTHTRPRVLEPWRPLRPRAHRHHRGWLSHRQRDLPAV